MTRLLAGALRLAAAALLGALLLAMVGAALYVRSLPKLSIWHRAELDEEFTAGSEVRDFAAYLALEERLFAELDAEVTAYVPTGPTHVFNRYSRGSLADPARWPLAWNRTFELRADAPRAAVLLLHGLSDAPYSLRRLGERLAEAGATVVGLRVPGHGTAPSGLVTARWPDMAAAVRLAARHLGDTAGDAPLNLVGYSHGGALAVEYALASLGDDALPRPAGLVLLSPEIGISPAAALAQWQARLGHALGIETLAWTSIEPEYDPFKYNSFATNAADLAHRLTAHIQAQLDAHDQAGRLGAMPRILAFQSAVDATVSAPALVEHLFARLPAAGHELVLYDLNRQAGIEPLLVRDPAGVFVPMLRDATLDFAVSVVTHARPDGPEIVARQKAAGSTEITERPLAGRWPPGVYSLSHIALPFAPDDPLYGGPAASASPGIALGNVALRGERGVLHVAPAALLRLHWNPFYDYQERRILDFVASTAGAATR